jgi:hypothetical protein
VLSVDLGNAAQRPVVVGGESGTSTFDLHNL